MLSSNVNLLKGIIPAKLIRRLVKLMDEKESCKITKLVPIEIASSHIHDL